MSALAKRVITAVAMLAFVFAAIFALPTRGFALVLLLVVAIASLEWAKLAGFAAGLRIAYAAAVAAIALAMLFAPAFGFAGEWPPLLVFTICGAATVFWLVIAPCWVVARWPMLPRAAMAAIGGLLLVAFWMALVVLHARSPATLVAAMALVWIADTAAFFAGRRFGRHKLAPQVSPGKTWEGVAGALAGVALYAVACAWLGQPAPDASPASSRLAMITGWVAVALVLAAMSIVGDLFESWMKRGAGVKDSGTLLPGHGGVLDRIDALLAAMPATALAVHEWTR
jgi:phosphatidate cytidylyltransferase